MTRLAQWCFAHRLLVVGVWIAILLGLAGSSAAIGSRYIDSFSLPGTDSTTAMNLLTAEFGSSSGDASYIVLRARTGAVTDPAIQSALNSTLAQIQAVAGVGTIRSPFSPQGAAQISADRQIAYATVTFAIPPQDLDTTQIQRVVDIAQQLRTNALQVELGGAAIGLLDRPAPSGSELFGIAVAAVVLLLAFGSLLAMAIPLMAAIVALGSAIFAIELLSHVIEIGSIAPIIAALVGLGVGIDYALFIVTRYRNGLTAGLSVEEAAVTAVNTSGRAVLFAGATVAAAMLGLLTLGVSFLSGIGISAAVMLLFAVAVAVTLLPALFGVFGIRILSRRQRRRLAVDGQRQSGDSGPWARWATFVQMRPIPLSIVATVVLGILLIPFFSLRLGSSDAGNNPAGSTTRESYDLLATGFGPGYNGPLLLVAQSPTAASDADLTSLVRALSGTAGVASVQSAPARPGSTVRTVQVTPTTSPESAATDELIDTLRQQVIPRYEQHGLTVYVGGLTATFKDFAAVLSSKLPLFITVIVVLGCLLLMLAFRSILVPLTAAVMNLLSAGAAFGVTVAVFQWGWGSEALGAGGAGPVESFLPPMMLAILFGLSMDYEVFLVSRIHEEWLATGDNQRAVRVGQAATGRVITAASLIMIGVFMAFVFGGQRAIAEFGVGLAAAILLDALVVRTILVPAVMQLLGTANWYLPRSIDQFLPRLSIEAPAVSRREASHLATAGQAGSDRADVRAR